MSDLLQQLFRCERYAEAFPRGMSVRACLRRQLEREPSDRKGVQGRPRRPFCAEECAAGLAHRLAACSAAVELAACVRCGAALIGMSACETCDVAGQETSKRPARGFLPGAPAPSTILWTSEVPNTPIAPPKAVMVGLTPEQEAAAAARVRAALEARPRSAARIIPRNIPSQIAGSTRLDVAPNESPAPTTAPTNHETPSEPPADAPARATCRCGCGRFLRADNASGFSNYCGAQRYAIETARDSAATVAQHIPAPAAPVNHEPLAEPAEETTMPRGKRETPWPCCGSQSHRHRKDCASVGKASAVKPPPRGAARPGATAAPAPVGLWNETDEQLVEGIRLRRTELERRKQEAEERSRKLDQALAEVKAA